MDDLGQALHRTTFLVSGGDVKRGRRRSALTLCSTLALGLAVLGGVAGANHSELQHVSAGQINGNGAFPVGFAGSSEDGSRVFFETGEQLVSTDTDSSTDVYERSTGTTSLVSAGQINGNGAFDASYEGSSADGSRVFFETHEQLVSADTDSNTDVYERSAATTKRVSSGGSGPFDASFSGASADGTRVFFETSERLISRDTDSVEDVYERSANSTKRVSTGEINAEAAEFSGASADGTRVFFWSREPLVPADGDAFGDVYERSNGSTKQISAGEINGDGPFDAFFDGASVDGSRAFFVTDEQLVSADTDAARDLYQRSGGSTELLSAGEINGNGDFDVFTFSTSPFQASDDGTRVWFETSEQLVPDDTDEYVDIYERSGGTTTRVSAGQINGNGPLGASFVGASADGSRVYFRTNEKLVNADTDTFPDIYRRTSGNTTRISAGHINGNGAFIATFAGVSEDGLRAFFHTDEALVSGDTDARQDVYERSGGATTKVSPGNGPRSQHAATYRGASSDGSAVFFTTGERLLTGDQDQVTDVYGAYVAP
jgi:hypothetical protein